MFNCEENADLAVKVSLPVINNPQCISADELEQLMQMGFCFVKLPDDEQYEASYQKIYDSGLRFFQQPKSEKVKYAFDSEKLAGYIDRRDSDRPLRLEQFICRPDAIFGPFAGLDANIADVTRIYRDYIAKPILKEILNKLGLIKHYDSIVEENFSSISLPYYPPDAEGRYSAEISPHKDFEIITVLAINKPGLQVFYENQWINVFPRKGYVVVNLANILEKMTACQCKSALHRVLLPEKNQERMSFGLFTGQNLNKPVTDLTTGEELFSSTMTFLKLQLNEHFFQELNETPTDKESIKK